MKSTILLILGLLILALGLGYNYFYRPFDQYQAQQTENLELVLSGQPNEATASATLSFKLTDRQKIAQLLAVPLTLERDELSATDSAWLRANQPGMVTLFGTQISTVSAQTVIGEIKQISVSETALTNPKLFPLIVVDHEGGSVQRLTGSGFTRLPSWQTMCAQPATTSAQLLSRSASELAAVGIDVVFAPMIDLARINPVLGSRICSDQPSVIITKANQYMTAMEQVKIQAVFKHFPGIGQTTKDLHTSFDQVEISPTEAMLYQELLKTYPQSGVMVSHVGVLNQYPDLPCSLSSACVGQITQNYPNNLVFSDALEMTSARYQVGTTELKSLELTAAEAISSGNQVLVFGPQVSWSEIDRVISFLEKRYQSEDTFKNKVDTALTRVIEAKL